MAAERRSPAAFREWLVRLAQLRFDDFLLLAPETLGSGRWTDDLTPAWSLAVNNAPHVGRHFRLQIPDCRLPQSSIEDVRAAQRRLVHAFAYELLRAKAPALYDVLPWHDWDFAIVTKRFKLWQTRLLLAGDGATVAMCRCRKSAGIYVLEPCEAIARYTEQKGDKENARRLKLLRAGLDRIPLPDGSADLAVVGSVQGGPTSEALAELARVATSVLLIENSPLWPPLAEPPLTDAGFRPDSLAVSGLGPRRCWWWRA